jgi:hypothetical protein
LLFFVGQFLLLAAISLDEAVQANLVASEPAVLSFDAHVVRLYIATFFTDGAAQWAWRKQPFYCIYERMALSGASRCCVIRLVLRVQAGRRGSMNG